MNNSDKHYIITRYNDRLKKYGRDIRTLASGTAERHRLRFQILCEVGIEPGTRILDLGCGFGDFYGYLKDQGISVDYTGYDINPNLVESARNAFPSARFEVKDIQKEDFPEFDYIVSSNAFNLKLRDSDNYELIEEVLHICFEHANKGVAADLLSSYVDYKSSEAFHYNPERVFSTAKKITKRVCLRHDYPLYEFCVYLYPDFQGWGFADRNGDEP